MVALLAPPLPRNEKQNQSFRTPALFEGLSSQNDSKLGMDANRPPFKAITYPPQLQQVSRKSDGFGFGFVPIPDLYGLSTPILSNSRGAILNAVHIVYDMKYRNMTAQGHANPLTPVYMSEVQRPKLWWRVKRGYAKAVILALCIPETNYPKRSKTNHQQR